MSRRLGVSVAAFACVLLCGSAEGQDRVTMRPPDSAGLMTITGDIVDYTGEELTLRAAGGPVQRIPADQVLAVETYRTPAQLTGIEHFEAGRTPEAVQSFEEALALEGREWLRRDILAWLVKSHLRRNETELACRRFAEILADEPHTRHWDAAPLAWRRETLSPGLQTIAKQWLLQNSDALRILGASLLLDDPAAGATAQQELARISRGGDRWLGNLARAQLWRLETSPSPAAIDVWERDIGRMPEAIRAGPWFVLGQAHVQRMEYDAGAAALLRVLLVHNGNERLAARAGRAAAAALSRLNRADEAEAVTQELVERFGALAGE